MASKINFNILLAKADKNTSDARKLLEENKRLNQQQKSNSSAKVNQSKRSAIVYIEKKKQEIRTHNEEEARQLLLKKQQRDALQIKKNARKKACNNSVCEEAVQKYLNNTKNSSIRNSAVSPSNVIASGSNQSKPSIIHEHQSVNKHSDTKHKSLSATQTSTQRLLSSPPKSAKSYYDRIPAHPNATNTSINKIKKTPEVTKQPITTTQASNSYCMNSMSNTMKKNLPSSNASKQMLSYDQMLKMADNCQKDKIMKKSETVVPEKNPLKHTDLYYRKNSKTAVNRTVEGSSSDVSKTVIIPENLKSYHSSQNKPIENSFNQVLKTTKTSASQVPKKTVVSAWDKIVEDMKKKSVKKNKTSHQELQDLAYRDEDDDEYDSEMEDFIDDEECDDDVGLTKKKDYSKVIQEIFKYDPKRYKNIKEDDLDNMETNFHSLLKEERASLKLAIREDLEEQKHEDEREKKRLEKLKKRLNSKN